MKMTVPEKIKLLSDRKKITLGEVATRTGQTRQNLSNKLGRNSFTQPDLDKIADALDCDYDPIFTDRKTGEKI